MAINTQGHVVNVMPSYTAPNPNLVAFNPQAISQGVLSSIQIANELTRRRAALAQQAELEATRQARIEAELARSGILTQTAPGVVAGTNAQNQSLVSRLPAQDEAAIATANQLSKITPAQTQGILANLAFTEQTRPFIQNAKLIQAQTDDALALKRADVDIAKTNAEQQRLDEQAQLAPVQAELTLAQAQQALASITEDKKLSDAQKLAQIRNLNASARASEAQAAYTERDRPRTGGADQTMNQLRDVQAQIQALEKGPVVNPNLDNEGMPVPLIQYQSQTRDPSGAVIMDDPFFGPPAARALNPEAERRAIELKSLYDLRNQLTASIAGGGQPAKSSAPRQITSKAEFDALPPGSPFIFNGRQGVKK